MKEGFDRAAKAVDAINADVKALRDAKIKIGGSSRTCAVASAILEGMPSDLTVNTKRMYLSQIRAAVNDGKPFSMNSGRKAGKKTGAKTGGGAIMIAISPADTADKAAEKLRKGFEKMRAANDGLAALAAFLVDALDEAAAE